MPAPNAHPAAALAAWLEGCRMYYVVRGDRIVARSCSLFTAQAHVHPGDQLLRDLLRDETAQDAAETLDQIENDWNHSVFATAGTQPHTARAD